MALVHSPRIVTDGIALALDAGNSKSWNVGISSDWTDRVGGHNDNGTLVNGTFHNDGPFAGAGYVEFDGTGNAVSAPAGSDFAYGTGDFTIEGWFYPTVIGQVSGAGYPSHILFGQTVAATNYLLFGIDANGKLLYYRTSAGGGSDQFSSAPNGSVVLNKWQYIALCRNNGTTKAFVDGQEIISISDTFNFNNTDRNPTIGNYTHTFTTQPFNGYVSNFRILNGTGLYTSNFTPPTKPLTAVTNTVLLTCQGNSISDASSSGHTLTANGNISLTKEPFTGAGAVEFDGTGDYLSVPQSTDFQFSSSAIDFTIEAYVNGSAFSGAFTTIAAVWGAGGGEGQWLLSASTTGVLGFAWSPNSISSNFISGGTLSTNTWHHVAVTRSGNTFRLFVDGAETASGTASGTNSNNTQLSIGRYAIGYSAYDSSEWEGYISNFRILKGTALYTSNFAVPTKSLTAIENTTLLTCQGQNIKDNSSSAHTFTYNGNVKPTIVTSAFEFDGTDDYVQLSASSDLNFGTGNFTIEGWFNKGATTANQALLCSNKYYIFGNNGNWILRISSATQIALATYDGTGNLEYTEFSASTSLNTWHHFALVREGTGTNETKFYLDGVLKGSMTVSKSLTDAGTNGLTICDEHPTGPGNAPFNGKISNIKIYKGKGFTVAEVLQNYNTLKGRYA